MIAPRKLSVLIVHHAPVTRFGLMTLLKSSRGFKVVGEASSAPVALRLFTEIQPDLVILSLTLQHGDGISLLRDFRKMNRAARTLVLTAREDPLSVQRAFRLVPVVTSWHRMKPAKCCMLSTELPPASSMQAQP